MELLHYLRNALVNLFKRGQMNDDLEEELKHHLAMSEKSNLESGMSPIEARRAARVEFGGVEKLREECRDSWGTRSLETLIRDLRLAGKRMADNKRFSAIVIVTLALGIGVNTSIFTIVNGILNNPLPTENGDEVVVVRSVDPRRGAKAKHVSYPDYIDMREGNRTFARLEAIKDERTDVVVDGRPKSYNTAFTTPGMLSMLQTQPMLGRGFVEQDNEMASEPVVILGYRVWRNDFAQNPDVIGKTLRVNNRIATVIGVLPENFVHPLIPGIWMTLAHDPSANLASRSHRDLHVWGLLKADTNLAQANADIAVIAQRNAAGYIENEGIGSSVQLFTDRFPPPEAFYSAYGLMFASVGLVLLICCSTVTNLLLGDAVRRRVEMATRAALGASRWQIVRQLMTENVSLSLLGGGLGLLLSLTLLNLLGKFGPEIARTYAHLFETDYRVFGFLTLISLACGILFGMAPALKATQIDLSTTLNESAHLAGSFKGRKLSATLVVFQFALTTLFLTGAGSTISAFLKVDAGNDFIPADEILIVHPELPVAPGERYENREARIQFYDTIVHRLKAVAGVSHVALASSYVGFQGPATNRVEIAGRAIEEEQEATRVHTIGISPEYFSTIELPITMGRNFTDTETERDLVAVVTKRFSETHWPGESALGKKFRFWTAEGADADWFEIVGISADLEAEVFDSNSSSVVFLPYLDQNAIMVRVSGGAGSKVKTISELFREIDPDLPLRQVTTLGEINEHLKGVMSSAGSLLLILAVMALLISLIGVFAVVAQASAGRTKEIGIRKALGATPFEIQSQMAKRGAWQMVLGIMLGLALAVPCAQFLHQHSSLVTADVSLFVVVAAVLLGVGLLACWLPARRASMIDPCKALRFE